jgi:FkbM family methyltransferase
MKALNILKYYWHTTRSVSFMTRFVMANVYNFIPIKSLRKILSESSNKTYFFRTPFGNFLAGTTFGWYVLGPYYEQDIRNYIDKNIKEFSKDKSKVFIDVGAHIGRYAIELGKNYGYEVLAFEPSPETFRSLKINTLLSDVEQKVHLFNLGLGSRNSEMAFEHLSSGEGSDHVVDVKKNDKKNVKSGVKNDVKDSKIINVQITRFDDLDIPVNTKNIRLIMIDVEGFEYDVLYGMKDTLKKCSRVDLLVEIFDGNPKKAQTFKLMKELGFDEAVRVDSENWYFKKR